jgi:uncharacterized integral membrane protein (TIGR00697 family)
MLKNRSVSVSFMLMGILFCSCLIISNLLSVKLLRITDSLSISAAIIIFPVTYILNDCIAEVWGYRKARLIIWMGFLMNFFCAAVGMIAVALPAADFWKANEAHFDFMFTLAPRVATASLAAFLVGSFLNAYVMSRMKLSSEGRHFSVRAVVSTLWGESADSCIFFPFAFWGLMPPDELLKLMVMQVLLKTAYEIVMLPVTYRIVIAVKRFEGTDVFDKDLKSYNPFHLSDL